MENVLKTTKADEKALLEAESRYCSYGDTVHYLEPAKLFAGCNGSFLYDYEDKPYLDLQMWYSAVNFGYANPRLNDALKRQIDTLPQVASQYLHREKIELAAMLCESIKDAWGEEGRVHFNVGGSQAIEDSLKLVRNACGGKSLMIAFEGGYHGRTLGASSITSSLPLPPPLRALRGTRAVRALPVLLPLPLRQAPRRLRHVLRRPVRAPVRNRILRRVGP